MESNTNNRQPVSIGLIDMLMFFIIARTLGVIDTPWMTLIAFTLGVLGAAMLLAIAMVVIGNKKR